MRWLPFLAPGARRRIIPVVGSESSRDDVSRPGQSADRGNAGVAEETLGGWQLSRAVGEITVRFAEMVCPPEVRAEERANRVVGEFELLLGSVQPAARHALSAAFLIFDRAARLYPRAHGRRFVRLGDQAAGQYVRAVMTRSGWLGGMVRRLKGLIVMCYYELPEVKSEIGYRPDPYIAAVSQRRLARYGAQIRAGEAAVLAGGPSGPDQTGAPGRRPEVEQ
jgi:hypothetical protein